MNSEPIYVRLLGPVDAVAQGAPCPIAGVRRKSVLAILALCPGEVVASDRLIDLLWEDNPPATATNTLQRHISYLRRVLGKKAAIVAVPKGYILDISADAVDVTCATRLIGKGSPTSDHAEKAGQMRAALDLWRGPSLVDVCEVAWLRDQAKRLDELWLDANERLYEARLELGEHVLLVPEIEDLAVRYPFREHLNELLMVALYRSGRQADALAAYQRVRRTLNVDLGVDPGLGLRDLEAAILRQDPSLDWRGRGEPQEPVVHVRVTPAQLPRAIPTFTGRYHELEQLHDQLLPTVTGPAQPQATAISLITGTAGVGKTALAVHWAHRVKQRFPDGQLYVDLRGFDPGGAAVEPAEAVRGFLDALSVPHHSIPESPQAQVSLYRSMLAGKRILILADNARDEHQVRPLLPGAPGCAVVVTSRNQLAGLVAADGAHPLTLDRPSVAEARQILAQRLGTERIVSEPEAVDEIIASCARLPLALAIAAARAALTPTFPLAELATQLREAATTLSSFYAADPVTNIGAVFSWSYQTVSGQAARLFRLLGPCPGPDISLPAAASLTGLPATDVRPLLVELARAHLISQISPGRYGFHDLLRAYAIEQTQRYDSIEQRSAARHRFLDHHLRAAHAATLLLRPARDPITLPPPVPGVTPQPLADLEAALTWFKAEHSVLLAAVTRPRDSFDRNTWQLAWTLLSYLTIRGDWRNNELAQQAGLDAANRLGDPIAQAYAHRCLAKVYGKVGRLADAQAHNELALHLFEQAGDVVETATTYVNLGYIAERQGDIHRALTHAKSAHRAYQSVGDSHGQAYAANNIGWIHGQLGDHARGLPYCEEALDVFINLDDLDGAARTWDSLGALHFGVGDAEQGERCYQRAIAAYRRLGDRYNEAHTYVNLVHGRTQTGNHAAASQARQQAIAILDDLEPDAATHIRAQLHATTSRS